MMQDKRIAHAVMLGRARPHNGIFIELKPEFVEEKVSLEEFRESISFVFLFVAPISAGINGFFAEAFWNE